MRVDKYLKSSRIIKRRTVAKQACEQGRVFINEKKAKPGDEVKEEDIINIEFGSGSLKVKVLLLKDNAGKSEASNMYEIIEE
ncbi:MAG TPA: RNA-binding S4 domain-containing protein [Tissierellaceae bacterium]|nr:RNA-binding S4 domain-containing protein [Tissierellaceae bacterium]